LLAGSSKHQAHGAHRAAVASTVPTIRQSRRRGVWVIRTATHSRPTSNVQNIKSEARARRPHERSTMTKTKTNHELWASGYDCERWKYRRESDPQIPEKECFAIPSESYFIHPFRTISDYFVFEYRSSKEKTLSICSQCSGSAGSRLFGRNKEDPEIELQNDDLVGVQPPTQIQVPRFAVQLSHGLPGN
jgi:hypothetical protein